MLHRIECDAATGAVETIYQIAYKKGEEIIVLDVGIDPPEGFIPVDLESQDE